MASYQIALCKSFLHSSSLSQKRHRQSGDWIGWIQLIIWLKIIFFKYFIILKKPADLHEENVSGRDTPINVIINFFNYKLYRCKYYYLF